MLREMRNVAMKQNNAKHTFQQDLVHFQRYLGPTALAAEGLCCYLKQLDNPLLTLWLECCSTSNLTTFQQVEVSSKKDNDTQRLEAHPISRIPTISRHNYQLFGPSFCFQWRWHSFSRPCDSRYQWPHMWCQLAVWHQVLATARGLVS